MSDEPLHTETESKEDKQKAIEQHFITLAEFAKENKFADFWNFVKEVNRIINTTLSLSKEFRISIREQIGNLCEEVKLKQTEHKEKSAIESAILRHNIDKLIDEALAFNPNNDGLKRSMDKLDEAQKLMKGEGNEPGSGQPLTYEDKDYCWEKWKDARTDINLRKTEVKEINFNRIMKEIEPIEEIAETGDPYRSKDAIKELRQNMKGLMFEDHHYEEINKRLTANWDRSMNRIGLIKEEKEQKHLKWRSDMEARITYFRSTIDKNNSYISRLEAQMQDLKEKMENPKTVSVHDKIAIWIEDKKKEIEAVLANIAARR